MSAPTDDVNRFQVDTSPGQARAEQLATAALAPSDFHYGSVDDEGPISAPGPTATADPDLGPLANFVGTFTGKGFNTIFRPNSDPTIPDDNVLELNLTEETLSFSSSLGSVPNRGMVQADIFLNGVPYLQTVNDVTTAGKRVGIHVEPGIWLAVPTTTKPALPVTLARLASIPHGTTVLAQGTSKVMAGPPTIPAVDITPFFINGGNKNRFDSQTADQTSAARIPQNLTDWITAGTITQALLDDPNSFLRNQIAGQTITSTVQIDISTTPAAPVFGGGTDNIAFLLGDAAASAPNADAVLMSATFWIETVQTTAPGESTPRTTTQIQYSQTVLLNFNGLSWPHVSVGTLTQLGTFGQYFDRLATASVAANGGTEEHFVGISRGRPLHTVHNADGTWQQSFGWVDSAVSGAPGTFVSIGCAAVGPQLHVVGVTSDGSLWHTFRNPDRTWQKHWGNVRAQTSGPSGAYTAVSCSGIGQTLELVGVVDGRMWLTVRSADGTSWQPFAVIPGQGSPQ